MLEDRSRFHAEYRRLAGLAAGSSLFHICDRDIIREILSLEYSEEFTFD